MAMKSVRAHPLSEKHEDRLKQLKDAEVKEKQILYDTIDEKDNEIRDLEERLEVFEEELKYAQKKCEIFEGLADPSAISMWYKGESDRTSSSFGGQLSKRIQRKKAADEKVMRQEMGRIDAESKSKDEGIRVLEEARDKAPSALEELAKRQERGKIAQDALCSRLKKAQEEFTKIQLEGMNEDNKNRVFKKQLSCMVKAVMEKRDAQAKEEHNLHGDLQEQIKKFFQTGNFEAQLLTRIQRKKTADEQVMRQEMGRIEAESKSKDERIRVLEESRGTPSSVQWKSMGELAKIQMDNHNRQQQQQLLANTSANLCQELKVMGIKDEQLRSPKAAEEVKKAEGKRELAESQEVKQLKDAQAKEEHNVHGDLQEQPRKLEEQIKKFFQTLKEANEKKYGRKTVSIEELLSTMIQRKKTDDEKVMRQGMGRIEVESKSKDEGIRVLEESRGTPSSVQGKSMGELAKIQMDNLNSFLLLLTANTSAILCQKLKEMGIKDEQLRSPKAAEEVKQAEAKRELAKSQEVMSTDEKVQSLETDEERVDGKMLMDSEKQLGVELAQAEKTLETPQEEAKSNNDRVTFLFKSGINPMPPTYRINRALNNEAAKRRERKDKMKARDQQTLLRSLAEVKETFSAALRKKDQEIAGLHMELGKLYMKTVEQAGAKEPEEEETEHLKMCGVCGEEKCHH